MVLCINNPFLLKYNWTVELVQRLGGKISDGGYTALLLLFYGDTEKTIFDSIGFKILWKKEKNIDV